MDEAEGFAICILSQLCYHENWLATLVPPWQTDVVSGPYGGVCILVGRAADRCLETPAKHWDLLWEPVEGTDWSHFVIHDNLRPEELNLGNLPRLQRCLRILGENMVN